MFTHSVVTSLDLEWFIGQKLVSGGSNFHITVAVELKSLENLWLLVSLFATFCKLLIKKALILKLYMIISSAEPYSLIIVPVSVTLIGIKVCDRLVLMSWLSEEAFLWVSSSALGHHHISAFINDYSCFKDLLLECSFLCVFFCIEKTGFALTGNLLYFAG